MRLWHQALIPKLPRQQLLGQHRECCALRGKGWGKKHSTVDYVFKYNIGKLISYHYLIIQEMEKRGYKVSSLWYFNRYRGKQIGVSYEYIDMKDIIKIDKIIYTEHNDEYLKECIENLKRKGVEI